jgi:hypothetical protein
MATVYGFGINDSGCKVKFTVNGRRAAIAKTKGEL